MQRRFALEELAIVVVGRRLRSFYAELAQVLARELARIDQRANQVGQPAIPPPPPLRAANPTVRLPQLDEAPPRPIVAGPAVSQTAPTTHMPAPPLPEAPAEPEQDIEKLIAQQYQQYVQQYTQPPAVAAPARERSVTIAWVIAGVVVLALLVALFVLLR